jgi:diketogulonate reductase-like aldo/keto reductase
MSRHELLQFRRKHHPREPGIGVCNFNLPMIRRAVEQIGAPIASHQLEYHPFLSQAPMLAYLRSKAIPLTAYAPLAQGRAANDATLAAVGRKHGATAAQIAIAWLLNQEGIIAIPKAGRPESQKANLDALGISLDDEDRAAIAALPKDPALRSAAICTGMGCSRVSGPCLNGRRIEGLSASRPRDAA